MWNLVYMIIYENMLIYVKILNSLDPLKIVHSTKPINIFKISQILNDSQQNIDFKN